MTIRKPKAVFFDWDGTIVDSLGFVFDAHNHVRNHFGLAPWTNEEFKVNMVYSSKEIYPAVYGDKAGEAFKVLEQFGDDNYKKYVLVFDGAVETFDALRKAGVEMSIISNMRHNMLQKQVDYVGLRHYFEIVAGAGYADKDKPAPEPLLKAMNERGLQPEDILFVGDTVTDLRCAAAAGCRIAFLDHGLNQDDLIKTYNPLIVMKNIKEFSQLALTF